MASKLLEIPEKLYFSSEPTPIFNSSCDRCEAPALVIVKRGGLYLHFCAHHTYKNYSTLVSGGWSFNNDKLRSNLVEWGIE